MGVPEFLFHQFFDSGKIHHHLLLDAWRIFPLPSIKFVTCLCRNRESRGHGHAEFNHFSYVGTLATEEIFHSRAAICFTITKKIDILRTRSH